MKKSLQDQLLKAGLGNKQQARQINTAKKKQRKNNAAQDDQVSNAQAARAAQAEKDRQRNLELQAQAKAKAEQVQINQLVESNQIQFPLRGLPYYFLSDNKIFKCQVDEKTRIRLAYGQMGIVKILKENQQAFFLVSEDVINKLKSRNAHDTIVWHKNPQSLNEYLSSNEMEDWQYPKDLF